MSRLAWERVCCACGGEQPDSWSLPPPPLRLRADHHEKQAALKAKLTAGTVERIDFLEARHVQQTARGGGGGHTTQSGPAVPPCLVQVSRNSSTMLTVQRRLRPGR